MKKLTLLVAALATMTAYAQKAQVWDFGAEQLDTDTYENMLTVDEINSWYGSAITAGSTGIDITTNISASTGVNLVINGDGKKHRLRTTNTLLTRYDEKSLKDANNVVYTGYFYSNSGSNTKVYIEQTFEAGDRIEYYVGSNGGKETYEFLAPNGDKKQALFTAASKIECLTFYATETGKYRIYGLDEKLVVARIVRTPMIPMTMKGTVTTPTGMPTGWQLEFTDLNSNAKLTVTPNIDGTYEAKGLAMGSEYKITLLNANGYVISSADVVSAATDGQVFDLTITKIDMVTVSGTIGGLPAEQLAKLNISFVIPEGKAYIPEYTLTGNTFTLILERYTLYDIVVNGINDYQIDPIFNSIYATADMTDVVIPFTLKPQYDITIVPTGAGAADLTAAKFVFTRLDDEYVYSFTGMSGITLRDGVYTVKVTDSGMYTQMLTSNLKVDGAATTKQIDFTADINRWNFSDADFTGGGYSDTNTEYTYKTLVFKGGKSHNNTYLYAGNGCEVQVPVQGNSIVTVNACYEYHLFIGETTLGDAKTNSTSQVDALTYAYSGPAGIVTIKATGTSYINSIEVAPVAEYKATITVGPGKDYATIGEAIDAVEQMKRTADQTVTILIEPGNYEEMLRIHADNIILKNAAATPSLSVMDGGVNISENAVRITSYYGHGYNYYSMDSDYKWDARTLAVNKENGYHSTVNTGGSSTTYWNSTVVVYGKNFTAEGIIFENSYNQYISKKESEDIVVEGTGSKGVRPTDEGNTAVQSRAFRERACAIAFAKGSDRGMLKGCRVISRQDAIYGDNGVRVAIDGGILNGACDYIFGGMTLAVRKAELAMLVTSDKNDEAYLTASKSTAKERGYLFWECSVTSAKPEIDMVESATAQPGLWGRPWDANAETVFYNTTVETNNGASLIAPEGWGNGLVASGSPRSYEYGTVEKADVNNAAKRVSWATVLTAPTLPDGTAITLFNFTKGADGWNPFNESTTGISNINTPAKEAQKVMVNGTIYILRDGNYYTLLGTKAE